MQQWPVLKIRPYVVAPIEFGLFRGSEPAGVAIRSKDRSNTYLQPKPPQACDFTKNESMAQRRVLADKVPNTGSSQKRWLKPGLIKVMCAV